MLKPLTVTVEATSGKRSATEGEPEGQKGRRKHKHQPGGSKDDVTMEHELAGSKGNAKGKLTDTKLHNAVLKTIRQTGARTELKKVNFVAASHRPVSPDSDPSLQTDPWFEGGDGFR